MNTDKLTPSGIVTYRLFDKNGKAKKMFQGNALFRFLLRNGYVNSHTIKIPGLFGYWTTNLTVPNLVTTVGKALVASRLGGSGSAAVGWIAVGTGVVAANVADTTLGTETAASGLSRAAASISAVTTTTANDTMQAQLSFSVTGSVAVTESGVFNASSAGTLLCRQVFSAINVINGDTLQMTWKVAMS